MVNDINTLNGSLQALGEKMASNLTAMGVPSTYDEGLNTLADKILQVAPVKTLDHINVELIAGNQILSYADEQQTPDSQYATVRFTAYDEEDTVIPNLTLDFQVGTGTVTTVTTDSDGRYEYTYHSQGVGDVEISASKTVDGILVSKRYDIKDYPYWNDGSSVGSLEIGSGAICTSNGSYITLTTNTSGEKDVKLPVNLTGDWEFTTDIAELGTNQDLTFKVGSGSQWGAVDHTTSKITVNLGDGSTYYTKTISKDDTLKITYVNGVMSVYWNDEYLTSRTVSISGKMGYYQVSGRTYHIKNIKLKPL